MARLYINKNIAADADKMKYWLSGEDAMSFSDIRCFMDWMPHGDNQIDIELHSCGGDCTEGYAIYDALRTSGKEISVNVVGRAASMATVILLAAPSERRRAFEHAEFLIHEPYIPSLTGNVGLERLEEIKGMLETEREKMIAVYEERTGIKRDVLEAQMKNGGWFNADKAIELGFVSSIVPAISATAEPVVINNSNMEAKEEVKVGKGLLDRLLAKCGYAKIEDVPEIVAMELTTSDGEKLSIEREDGSPAVGDKASPDGSHVMPDGETIVVKDGKITEIKEPKDDKEKAKAQWEEEKAALQAKIDEQAQTISGLQGNQKSEDDKRILGAVDQQGGEAWLQTVASTYTPAGRAATPQSTGKKDDGGDAPQGRFQQRLAQLREGYKQA